MAYLKIKIKDNLSYFLKKTKLRNFTVRDLAKRDTKGSSLGSKQMKHR